MADNVAITAGAGTTIASDDIASVQHQRVKVSLGADGTAVDLNGDSTGGAWMQGAVAHDAADSGNPLKVGGKALSALPTAVTANDRVNAYFDTFGIQQVALRDAAGAAIATGVQYVEDTAITADAGQGTLVVARRDDALSTLTPVEGDATGLRTNNRGALWIVHDGVVTLAALPAGTNNIGDVDVLTLPGVAGDIAHDAADSGNPLKIGGKAATGTPAAVANNDRVNAWLAANGQQAVFMVDAAGNGVAVITTADAVANQIVQASAAMGMVYNGTTWDRIRGDITNGVDVDVTRLPALVAGSANIGDVDVASIAAGDNNIGNVDVVTLPNVTLATSTNTIEVVGDVAEDAALAGNPQRVGFRASTAIPTAMSADNDIVTPWANRSGAPVVTQAPHVGLNSDPWALANKTAQYTTTQTSAVLQAGGASEKIVVTQIQIQVGGTTAGTLQVYFGTGAYSRGTSRAIFDGEFAPSATLKPGVVMNGPFISGANGDDVLVTTSAAINPLTISVWYYVVV